MEGGAERGVGEGWQFTVYNRCLLPCLLETSFC